MRRWVKGLLIFALAAALAIGGYFVYLALAGRVFYGWSFRPVESGGAVAWSELVKGEIGRDQGWLDNDFSPAVLTIKAFRAPNLRFYEAYGYNHLEHYLYEPGRPGPEPGLRVFKDETVRPFKTAGFYQTDLGGEQYLVAIQKWQSWDGSVSYVPLVARESYLAKPSVRQLLDGQSAILTPVVKIKDLESCRQLPMVGENYCAWFMENQAEIQGQTAEWLDSGILPRELSRFPLPMSFIGMKI